MSTYGRRHAVHENGFRYWFALTRNTAAQYWHLRRPLAAARALLPIVLFGYFGERCDDCGRAYPLWWCDDPALWGRIAEQTPYACLLCLNCFDKRARRLGIQLDWRPQQIERRFS